MRYTYRLALGSSATPGLIGTTSVFQLNSCYEPLDTAASQPYGFDQMAQLYGRYKVHSVKVRCQYATAAQGTGVQLAVHPPEDSSTIAGLDAQLQAAKSNTTTLLLGNGMTGSQIPEWSRTFKVYELLGISKKEYEANIEEYSALVSANPGRMVTLECGGFNWMSNASTTVYTFWTIVQEVEFSGRLPQALS